MGLSARGYGSFRDQYAEIVAAQRRQFRDRIRNPGNPDHLFGFLLADDRPSQLSVQRFGREHLGWIDQLSRSANVYFFVYGGRSPRSNPSLVIAERFGIRPNQLPGIVLFTAFDESEVGRAVYLPLKPGLFDGASADAEAVVADLFSLIQEARCDPGGDVDLLARVERRVEGLRRGMVVRPLLGSLGQGVLSLAKLPAKLVETMCEVFAKQMAESLTPAGEGRRNRY